MLRRDGSLLFRLTIPSLLTVLLLWVGDTAFWAKTHENEARQSFNESGGRAAALFSGAVADTLWEFDQRATEATLAGLGDWPGFVSASVTDSAGTFAVYHNMEHPFHLHEFGVPPPQMSIPEPGDGYVHFRSDITHPLHGPLGNFLVVFDEREVEQAILKARHGAIVSAVIWFLLMSTLLTLVARSVTRPLVRITQAIERVAHGELDFEVPESHSTDEVGRLAKALDVFRKNAKHLVEAKAEAEANRRVAELAMVDELTGLANRRAVIERFSEIEQGGSGAAATDFSLVHVDLDGFKQINDTMGHEAGDHVLKEVARRFRKFADSCDLIARVGGDEFLLLVQRGSDHETPETIAEALIWEVAQPVAHDKQQLRIGASAGVAHYGEEDAALSDTLINADIALYRAKAQGKGRFVTFDKKHRLEILARKKTHDEIVESIKEGRFIPYFQGIFDAQTEELSSVEMLARWDHPTRGILTPIDFLDIAQELNLMRLIDEQVLKKAVEVFKSFPTGGRPLPRLCVNVSVTRLVEPDFLDMLDDAIRANISMDVELLESIFLDDPSEMLLWQLKRIRGLGVGLNIDDFGTGHASVAGLLKIKPDKVKIDRCFVAPMLESSQSFNLIETLNGLCRSLDIETVAEGVETREHARALHDLGVKYLQGFGLMPPVPSQELGKLLSRTRVAATGS